MTTQRDLDVAADANRKNDMPVCDQCGWYALMGHGNRCNPEAGRMAKRLIESVPDVRSGQLGYGAGKVVFDLSDGLSVIFGVVHGGQSFSLHGVDLIELLTVDEAADLVRAIKKWTDEVAAKRGQVVKRLDKPDE